jgi:hypothetical protein
MAVSVLGLGSRRRGLGLASSAPPGPVGSGVEVGSRGADEGVEQPSQLGHGQRDELAVSGCAPGSHLRGRARKLVSTCDAHAAIAQDLSEPGALSVCGLCEDLTGTAEPMTIASVEPWDSDHQGTAGVKRIPEEIDDL